MALAVRLWVAVACNVVEAVALASSSHSTRGLAKEPWWQSLEARQGPVCDSLSVQQKELCGEKVANGSVKPLLITGSPSSGTHSIAAIFTSSGVNLTHESPGPNGSVAWPYAVDSVLTPEAMAMAGAPQGTCWKKWLTPTKIRFSHVVHLVRCPVNVISAMMLSDKCSIRYMRYTMRLSEPLLGHLVTDRVRSLMEVWLAWNLHLEKYAEARYKIEDFPEMFQYCCTLLGIPSEKCRSARLPTGVYNNHHKYTPLRWADLREADSDLAQEIHAKAVQYGFGRDCTEDPQPGAKDAQPGTKESDGRPQGRSELIGNQDGPPGDAARGTLGDCDDGEGRDCSDGLVWLWDE